MGIFSPVIATFLGFAAGTDYKARVIPNWVIVALLVVSSIGLYVDGFALSVLFLLILVAFIGLSLILYGMGIWAAGDAKLFMLTPLIIGSPVVLIRFIIYFAIALVFSAVLGKMIKEKNIPLAPVYLVTYFFTLISG